MYEDRSQQSLGSERQKLVESVYFEFILLFVIIQEFGFEFISLEYFIVPTVDQRIRKSCHKMGLYYLKGN